ncbi:serendipity locus protein H-1 [Stomoxys calcitrans]|uniref:C2H2-type domain-containing protein n=1 Tax=Stomoxys calcitrans TaxID=35570 RepID=A0A1I8PNU4_STOCA|nr:serendipity locus protein H-1 [Stomoxys calcitrans]
MRKMKEEAETCSKLPPKIIMGGVGGSSPATTMIQCSPSSLTSITARSSGASTQSSPISSTPSKQQPSDEILASLLRMNNFDSISSIKDESLDIDLSACVTISADPSGMIGGNSLSSSDFWKALDESAQTPQLDVSGGAVSGNSGTGCSRSPPSPCGSSNNMLMSSEKCDLSITLKKEQTDFSGTFLKPSSGITCSPLKRSNKPPAQLLEQQHILKEKSPTRFSKPDTTGSAANGPPSLAPIIRLNQFPKPPIDLPKINKNGTTAASNLNSINSNMTQPPPLTALDCSPNNKNEVAPKIILEPIYRCLDCDVAFQGGQELANHSNHRITYKCRECEREFDAEPSLKKHLKTHRPIDARKDAWKKCPDCGKCLKLGSMWMHRKIHTENKKYGCEICGQKFVQKINLTHHQRIHTSEKPYECSECQKRFQERSHLQRHQKYHAQTRSYRCEKCGKMYKTERCLKVHNLVHLEQRPFACTVCDKSFISNSKLKQHSNIHTGERPFKCNYCPRDFTNFPNWLKHTRRRHKVDHKTGEMLENIPSYCSKKSTRTPKEKKTNAAEVKSAGNAANNMPANQQNATSSSSNNCIDLNKMDTSESNTKTTPTIVTSVVPLASAAATVVTTKVSSSVVSSNGPPPLAKVPAKRKKKIQTITVNSVIKTEKDATTTNFIVTTSTAQNSPLVNLTTSSGIGPPPLALVFSTKPINAITTNLAANTTTTAPLITHTQQQNPPANVKIEKSKRERKQSMPKQVQQVPPPIIIKKEFIEPKAEMLVPQVQPQQQHPQRQTHENQQPKAPFPDLHCLSITSAEDLIMEQALEMEECGLFKANSAAAGSVNVMPNFAETDNAISSESVANMHFKIKEEHHDMELKTEEYDSLKKSISSLESSPFSSPASMEFASSSTLAPDFTGNNFYLPQFTITNNQLLSTNSAIATMKVEDTNATTRQVRQLVATNINGVPELIQITNAGNARYLKTNIASSNSNTNSNNNNNNNNDNASSFINQLYLPLTVNAGPVLMKSHQALPSVDTLLFSHSKLALFNNRNLPKQATTAQHNLS